MDATAILLLTKLSLALGCSDEELRATVEELVRDFGEEVK